MKTLQYNSFCFKSLPEGTGSVCAHSSPSVYLLLTYMCLVVWRNLYSTHTTLIHFLVWCLPKYEAMTTLGTNKDLQNKRNTSNSLIS